MTEKEIQKYLWENKDRLEDIIDEINFPDKYLFDQTDESIYERSPSKILYNELIDRYSEIYKRIHGLNLFGYEVPLKKDGDSTIRADLLGKIDGVSGLTIIEIKKSVQTERQAYTELFAYASHLQAIFPGMSKDDIHYILISPMEERIVREATINSFFFDEKPVFAFIPEWKNNDITTLKLKPWIPQLNEIVKIIEFAFSQKNFQVFKVCWEGMENWNPTKGNNPSKEMIDRMNKISNYAAQLMDSKGINGFVYTSQSWPEMPLLQNALIIAGLNPFKVAKDNFLLNIKNLAPHKLDTINDEDVTLLDIIPELINKAKEVNEETNFFYNMMSTWDNTIVGIALDTVNLMTSNTKKLDVELSWGSMTWEDYQINMIEDVFCFNYNIKTTGLIRKLFVSYTSQDYEYISKYGITKHPFLSHGDIPNYIVDYLNSQAYFRDFLYNLFENYKDITEEFEENTHEK